MSNTQKFLLVGTGGQGVLTAARLLGLAAMRHGTLVHVGQLHGMSQRGGSVEGSVVFGPGRGSYVTAGEAQVVLALEPLEALRAIGSMNSETIVIVERQGIRPFSATMAAQQSAGFDEILARLRSATRCAIPVEGRVLAKQAGNERTLNTVLLGVLAGLELLPFSAEVLAETLMEQVPPSVRDVNQRALELGIQRGREQAHQLNAPVQLGPESMHSEKDQVPCSEQE